MAFNLTYSAQVIDKITTGGKDYELKDSVLGAAVKTAIEALEADVTKINGGATVDGSIAKALADAKKYADEQIAALDLSDTYATKDDIKNFITTGAVTTMIEGLADTYATKAEATKAGTDAEAAAKKYTDDELAKLDYLTDEDIEDLATKTEVETAKTNAVNDAKTYTDGQIEGLADVYATLEDIEDFATKTEVETAKTAAINAAKAELDKLAGTDWTEAAGTVADIIAELKGTDEGDAMVTLVDKLKGLGDKTVKGYVDDAVKAVDDKVAAIEVPTFTVEGSTLVID